MFDSIVRSVFADPFRTVYEDPPAADDPPADDPEGGEEQPPQPPAKPAVPAAKPKLKVPLSAEQQDFVNSLLAEERRKAKAVTDRAITQLEAEKNRAGTTQAEKETLEARIDDLKNAQLTAEEFRKKEEKKKETKQQAELAAKEKEIQKWKDLYTGSTVRRAITDAAVEHKAHNPKHIVKELVPDTRLIDELDEDEKPTGELVPRVRMQTVKDGKPAVLDMTVTEAVKFMSEQEEHAPLFNSGATGGLGHRPNTPGGKARYPDEPPTDAGEYQVWRKKQKEKTGARH